MTLTSKFVAVPVLTEAWESLRHPSLDGVTERLSTYRGGIERISALINRRAEMIVALPPL